MKQKSTIAIILTAVFLLVVLTATLVGAWGTASAQNLSADSATPVPMVTPMTSSPTAMGGTNMSGCSMMNGTSAGMSGMGAMQGTSGSTMNNMGQMGSMMMGTNMQGMGTMQALGNMFGMSNMPNTNDNYIILTDPSTWLNGNPWILLGWIVLFLVLLALVAAIGLGVFYIGRRIAFSHSAPKA